MELYKKGNLAISKAGRDKGQIYVIINEDSEYVYLCNGTVRTADKPKKKRKKHVQPIVNGVVCEDFANNEIIREVIRHYIGG